MESCSFEPLMPLDRELHVAVFFGDIERIRALLALGADLESTDLIEKTPLMKACMRPRMQEVAAMLIELGANVNASHHGRTALHEAACAGCENIVNILLSHGANPYIRDDYDNNTALEFARKRGHANVVRVIERRISLFRGWMREKCGPELFMKRKIWVVVLPSEEQNPTRPLKFELAIYPGLQASNPCSVIKLWNSEIEEQKLNVEDPSITIFDEETKSRYEILSADEGDKQKLQQLYDAFLGIAQIVDTVPIRAADPPVPNSLPANASLAPSELSTPGEEDAVLAMAIYTSVQSAIAEGVPNVELTASATNTNEWGNPPPSSSLNVPGSTDAPAPLMTSSQARMDSQSRTTYNEMGVRAEPGESRANAKSNDSTPSRRCVICLDAPVEGACIPCGHMAFCMSCLKDIKSQNEHCPICRATINQVMRIYDA